MADKSNVVRARIQPALKDEAARIFHRLGLTHSQAIQMFYNYVILNGGLAFEARIPNAATRQAFAEAENSAHLPRYQSVDALFDEIEAEE